MKLWQFFYRAVLTFTLLAGATGATYAANIPIPRDKPTPPPELLRNGAGEAYRAAFKHAGRARLAAARKALPSSADQMARDLVTWYALGRGANAPFEEVKAFIKKRPDWPLQTSLLRRVEEAVGARTPDADILSWFGGHPPVSGKGRLFYAAALFRAGEDTEAEIWLKKGWRTANLSSPQERSVLKRFGKHLSTGDHTDRVAYLLWQRKRQQASRLLRLLPEDQRALAKARMALIAFSWNVDKAVGAVPAHLRNDAGLVYDRAYWRRIKGKHEGARTLLLNAVVDGSRIERPDRWWRERHFQARRALREGKMEIAYKLAAGHALPGAQNAGNPSLLPLRTRAPIAEAEWLAGWIALRFLDRPADALAHFATMRSVVSLPVSLGRSAYWSGRAAEAMGDAALTQRWFAEAAAQPTTFYGQLAVDQLGGDLSALKRSASVPTAEERANFEANSMVEAIRFLSLVGADKPLGYFTRELTRTASSAGESELTAELGQVLERPNMGVIAAKTAAIKGNLIIDLGYPVIEIDGAPPSRHSLILAIARQESQFDPRAVSHVGAMGLMQLMPATASRVARQLHYPYSKERLLSDPAYNMTLGSTYFAGLLERFDGSPILALAAYNAGAGAVRRWLNEYGDPREYAADPIDWIELIPYSETRNYVQRVLEAAPIYSMRLPGNEPKTLSAFIETGRRPPPLDPAPPARNLQPGG